jgi:transcriptional regulator with XRE-family HTH domain
VAIEDLLMITAAQLRAARALVAIDQRELAELSGLSLPTIQRMEASTDIIRGNVDSLMKLFSALDAVGIELIGDNAVSHGGGRGVRLKSRSNDAAGAARRRTPRGSTSGAA